MRTNKNTNKQIKQIHWSEKVKYHVIPLRRFLGQVNFAKTKSRMVGTRNQVMEKQEMEFNENSISAREGGQWQHFHLTVNTVIAVELYT